MELANNENLFVPTPKLLKSSPVQILFIPFNNNESKCKYCNNKYSITVYFSQKYCKNCLLQYIKNIKNTIYYADSNTYLDVHIRTKKQCIQHKIARDTG